MAQPSQGATRRKSILVVDDVMLNRRLLGKLVESLGFEALYSRDGAEAIDQYQQLRNADDLFCILMDVQMPRVDGLEATKEIRSLEAAAAAAAATAPAPLAIPPAQPASSANSNCSSASCEGALDVDDTPATPCSRRVPIVGVSACTETDQLKSAALQGLPIDPATDRPWEVVGMDMFMAKPVNKAKLAAALETIAEAQRWSAFERRAAERASAPLQQQPREASLGATAASVAASASCESFASLSGGLDIQVHSRPGGQQVAKRSLGGCMHMASQALLKDDSTDEEPSAAKRPRTAQPSEPPSVRGACLVACDVPAA